MDIAKDTYELHDSSFVADMHAHPQIWHPSGKYVGRGMHNRSKSLFNWGVLGNQMDIPRMRDGGVDLQTLTILVNYWHKPRQNAMNQVELVHRIVEESSDLEWALTKEDAESVKASGKIGVVLGMEGAFALENDLHNLGWFHDKGVRSMCLSHFKKTEFAYSSMQNDDRDAPLTTYGKELVSAMNGSRMIVDLAHINYGGFFDAIDSSTQPVIVSHTGVCSCHNSRRNIDDAQIKAVAETGGVVGIIFFPYLLRGSLRGSVEHIVDHMDAVRDAATDKAKGIDGIDHVAFGSDFDGIITLPREISDVSNLPVLTQALLNRGYSHSDVKKVLGENFLRVYGEVCG